MAKSAAGPLASGSIDNFLGSFQNHGYLETNKFEVVLYPPFDINNRRNFSGQDQADIVDQTINGRQTQEHITLRAESVNLAGRNITSFEETNIYGPVKQIPTGVSFAEDINVTFLASETMMERDFFESWQQTIFDSSTWDLKYYKDFIGVIDIYTITRNNVGRKEFIRTYGIRCEEVWPKTIGPSELSMASGNELIKIPVNFAFRYWDRINVPFDNGVDLDKDITIAV